ncbi:myeloid differentiation primary response protein MyD88 [Diabrotica virgifera virgifera]|uniref:Myeloid differentiation primary response protein MyD88 n=1 Tax=Diabrotica virgifera virgifera TaxID=50390 RepID=A0ABM5IAP6_DIAVI|nr:myeloid differentiation primary response protein MyD88 [Diabrotica virgifera virgifera]
MSDIPVKVLRKETRDLISALLNPRKVIPNDKGLSRDWHGLAELCGISGEIIPHIKDSNDAALKVLDIWSEKNREESTTAKLLSFLEQLDRFDVVEDVTPLIEKDAEWFEANPDGYRAQLQDIDDKDIITHDDAERKSLGLPPQTYDAFVMFSDDDINFAIEIINKLEVQYKMKLCVTYRDVIGGENSHDAVIRLISTRCNRVVVVVSPSFLECPTHKYFYTLARMESIETRRRKIIPCIYKKCFDLPIEFRAYHLLDYTRMESTFGNFWDHLYKSLKVVIPPSTPSDVTSSTQRDVTSSTQRVPPIPQAAIAPRKSIESTKSTNHVKFEFLDQPTEVPKVENKTPPVEIPVETPAAPQPTPSTDELAHTELKKKNSFIRKFMKIVQKHDDKSVKEVPQINGVAPKKKRFWKKNKLKIPVAN